MGTVIPSRKSPRQNIQGESSQRDLKREGKKINNVRLFWGEENLNEIIKKMQFGPLGQMHERVNSDSKAATTICIKTLSC